MKATHANQKIAREIAESRTYADGVDYVALRAENMRRANAVKTRAIARIGEAKPLAWLMRDVCSTPYGRCIEEALR